MERGVPSEKLECRPGRDAPICWRSSFVRREVPSVEQGPWGSFDAAVLLARHIVPSRSIGIVRRITAWPWRNDAPREPPSLPEGVSLLAPAPRDGITFDSTPDWWHVNVSPPPPPNGQWEWYWNIGHRGIDDNNRGQEPGAIQVAPFARIRELLSINTFDMCDYWQRLVDPVSIALHGTDLRYVVEGPQVVQLWAICTLEHFDPNQGDPPPIPFASSFGSMEGVDVPVSKWYESPAQWLIP